MLIVEVLGSGSGLPTAFRDTTSLLVGSSGRWTLVECPGSVVCKLARRGVGLAELERVVLTHDHVDHIYGFPHLVHAAAIAGDPQVLTVCAPAAALTTIRRLLKLHRLEGSRYPVIELCEIPLESLHVIANDGTMRVLASPVCHSLDTVGLRFETSDGSLAHSSDTARCDAMVELAQDADLLLHDCAGLECDREAFGIVHSSARDAAEVAAMANVAQLRLIHLSPETQARSSEVLQEARGPFTGAVGLAADGDVYNLGNGDN